MTNKRKMLIEFLSENVFREKEITKFSVYVKRMVIDDIRIRLAFEFLCKNESML